MSSNNGIVEVAVGVITNSAREVLVARRHANAHQGGLLEFPGGKYEPGEDRFAGLQREFQEELGVQINAAYPLKKILHHYADKSVLLDVWLITDFSGEPTGLEGQAIQWLALSELNPSQFPAANKAIIDCLHLPAELAITPDVAQWSDLEDCLRQYVQQNIGIIQLRQKSATLQTYLDWYGRAQALCDEQVKLMFSHEAEPPTGFAYSGLHCTASQLMLLKKRPCSQDVCFAASCHNLEELRRAEALGADYVTLSPVCATAKYSDQQLLGWGGFMALREQISLPVYALGGMSLSNRQEAHCAGAHGIAGIRLFL